MRAIQSYILKNKITTVIFGLFLVVLLLSSVVITTSKLVEYNELQKEKVILEEQLAKQQEKNEELGFDLKSDIDEDYVGKYNPAVEDPNSIIFK